MTKPLLVVVETTGQCNPDVSFVVDTWSTTERLLMVTTGSLDGRLPTPWPFSVRSHQKRILGKLCLIFFDAPGPPTPTEGSHFSDVSLHRPPSTFILFQQEFVTLFLQKIFSTANSVSPFKTPQVGADRPKSLSDSHSVSEPNYLIKTTHPYTEPTSRRLGPCS